MSTPQKLANLSLVPFVVAYFVQRLLAKARKWVSGAAGNHSADPTAKNNEVVRAGAETIGCQVIELPNGFLSITSKGKRRHSRGSYFDFESLTASQICGDKEVSQQILDAAGLPVPTFRCFRFSQFGAALRFQDETSGRVVTKPSWGTADGAGVTIGIRTRWGFVRGFARALASSKGRVLVEEHCAGTNYRLTVLAGEIVSIIERKQAHVVGDGTSTVEELIRAKNARLDDGVSLRWAPIRMDRQAREYLHTQGYAPSSIPPVESEVLLSEMCFADLGGELRDVTAAADPSYAALACEAAALVGARLCGVDLITTDIARPRQEVDCVLNEVNTTPALYIVDVPGASQPTRIGERLVEMMMAGGVTDGRPSP